MHLTDTLDLRGGRNCWREADDKIRADPLPERADIVVIGAGIMGAMVAERLSANGRNVALVDRRVPATGATAASTALVMWGADVPLSLLAQDIGMEDASQRWRQVFGAVESLNRRISALGIDCGWCARPELYLAGDVLDRDALLREGEVRRAAGLPSDFLDGDQVKERFKIAPRPALLSSGSYEVDPVKLTKGLLDAARAHGASISFPCDVERLAAERDMLRVHCADGTSIVAQSVILASGYEAARLFLPEHFSLSSSFAIATKPGEASSWEEKALIWEASDPYLYTRATIDGRIIVGGEDEDFVDADKRDAMIPKKKALLETKAAALLERHDLEFECAWAATFGGSPDGLPAIGPARTMNNLFLAYGFGGNGVTFASLASGIIDGFLCGDRNAGVSGFDPYRPARKR